MSSVRPRRTETLARAGIIRTLSLIQDLIPSEARTLLSGFMAVQVISLILIPVLTRLYDQRSFGALATYNSACGLLMPLLALRYELAIPLCKSNRSSHQLTMMCIMIVAISSCVLGGTFCWMRLFLATYLNVAELDTLLWFAPITFFVVGAYNVLNQRSLRAQSYRSIRTAKVRQSLTQSAIQVGLAVTGTGALSLTIAQVVGQFTSAASLWRDATGDKLGRISVAAMKRLAVRYKQFFYLSNSSVLLNVGALHCPVLLLSAFYGPEVTGALAICNMLLILPWAVLGNTFSQLYVGQFANHLRDDRRQLLLLFLATTRRLVTLGLVPFSLAMICGFWILPRLLGSDWADAGAYVSVLAPMFYAQFVVSPVSQTLNLLERQDLQLRWDVIRLALVISVFCLAGLNAVDPVYSLALYSMVMVLGYIVKFLICAAIVRGDRSSSHSSDIHPLDTMKENIDVGFGSGNPSLK